MMFPCSALPPPLYPAFLRPPPALASPLGRSLPSGFLVEDLLRLSQPVGYIHRTFSSGNPEGLVHLSPGMGASPPAEPPNRTGSPGCSDSGCLKFGVSAILAPSTRSAQSLQTKVLPFFDGSLHPLIRASYFTASSSSSSVVPVPGTFSWPLAPRGKPRRGMLRRAVFSDLQRKALERTFQKQKYISKPDRKKLATKLGLKDSQMGKPSGLAYFLTNAAIWWPLSSSQVKIWFQNRRMKWRNSKERELLSTGGCRQQTLPTKTNPHPDLTDVGSTFCQRLNRPAADTQEPHHHHQSPSSPSDLSKLSESDSEEITVS